MFASAHWLRFVVLIVCVTWPTLAGCSGKTSDMPKGGDGAKRDLPGPVPPAPDPKSKPPNPPEGGNQDLTRLQGIWAVEEYDGGGRISAPPPAVVKTMRYIFEGQKLRIESSAATHQFTERFTFELDLDAVPRGMPVTRVDEAGKPLQPPSLAHSQWIYKWEGDILILARGGGTGRPTDFVAKKGPEGSYQPGIDVIRLKKLNEPTSRSKQ